MMSFTASSTSLALSWSWREAINSISSLRVIAVYVMIGLGLFSTAGQRLQLIHFKQNFKKKTLKRAFYPGLREMPLLAVHLRLDEVTNGTGGRGLILLLQRLHGFFLIVNVLGFDRQAQGSVLAIHVDDLGFDGITHIEN